MPALAIVCLVVLAIARPVCLAAPGAIVAGDPVLPVQLDTRNESHIRVSLVSELPYLVPGAQQQFALRLQPEPGWHTYWSNPGDSGKPTSLAWDLPDGMRSGELQWPVPEVIPFGGGRVFGYRGDTWLLVDVAMPSQEVLARAAINASGQRLVQMAAKATWLVCREVCVQGDARFALLLPLRAGPVAAQPPQVPTPASSSLTPNSGLALQRDIEVAFSRARAALPERLAGAPASYHISDNTLMVSVDAASLPVFDRRPAVLVATAGIVRQGVDPRVSVRDQALLISAAVGEALSDPPAFLPLLVVPAKGQGGAPPMWLLARYDPQNVPAAPAAMAGESTASLALPYVLLLALLGGLILNAMPCVFPVLSLKVLGLVQHSAQRAAERRMQGIAYTAGVVSSFLLVAAVLIALRSAGQQIGWGFQLQAPGFVALLVFVLFALGLSLSGLFELGTSLQNLGQGSIDRSTPLRGSFLTGVLATVVATPCTAPFMGTAMGFALTQPLVVSLLTFAVLGLGLALPFLVIALVPGLASLLPAPGNWMVRLKEFLAFPVYLTVVWLLWVFSRQAGTDAAAALLAGLVLLALALWLWRVTRFGANAFPGLLGSYAVAALAVGSAIWALQMRETSLHPGADPATGRLQAGQQAGHVQPWSPERLQRAIEEGKTVFVNMTADWCITCKVNERVALSRDEVVAALSRPDVSYLVGDWTNSDARISAFLESFERNGVPLYAVFRPGEPPRLLPQVLTPGIVLEALGNTAGDG